MTKDIIHSAAMVFEKEIPEVEKAVEVFKERLESFVTKFFGTHEKLSVRVFDFDSLLEQLQTVLKRLRREW